MGELVGRPVGWSVSFVGARVEGDWEVERVGEEVGEEVGPFGVGAAEGVLEGEVEINSQKKHVLLHLPG